MTFQEELRSLINRHSMEGKSDTPDFILAEYIGRCLDNFADTMKARDHWWGFKTTKLLETPTPEYCGDCDGVGWYEGGRTLQTPCHKCDGSGLVKNCTPVVEPIQIEADGAGAYQVIVAYAFKNKSYQQILSKRSVEMVGVEDALRSVHPELKAFPLVVNWKVEWLPAPSTEIMARTGITIVNITNNCQMDY